MKKRPFTNKKMRFRGKGGVRSHRKSQERKAQSAETEAAYREEQNKLIESYDQIAGRTPGKDKKKKKGELAEVGVKKPER